MHRALSSTMLRAYWSGALASELGVWADSRRESPVTVRGAAFETEAVEPDGLMRRASARSTMPRPKTWSDERSLQ